jgi:hypothetical protein
MTTRSRKRPLWTSLVVAAGTVIATVFATGTTSAHPAPAPAASSPPCDIYAAAGTPCVSADSTVRALYASYDGPLYQVKRASDGTTRAIRPLSAGGGANAAEQDSFCANTTCRITEIYDQSPRHNDLTVEGAGTQGAADIGAPAAALPVRVGGHRVYGVKMSGGMGYRDDTATGVAENGQPEGMYMVSSGTFVNHNCCFDYGNTEKTNTDTGNGHMDAVNLSTRCRFEPCYGPGPWVQADLENGLYRSSTGGSKNPSDTGPSPISFATVMLRNNGQNHFTLDWGNAQSGDLTTTYSGPEPTINGGGYSPMHQEGGIVLGTGGDNSNTDIGTFFEGVMTAGVPTATAEAAVQANIVAARYGAG